MKFFAKPLAIALVAGFSLLVNPVSATGPSKSGPFQTFRPANDNAPNFRVNVQPLQNAEGVKLFLEKQSGKRLTVRLKSPSGDQLLNFLTDKKPANVFRKFNFTDAEEGVYTIEVSDGKQTISKKVVLQRSRSEVVTRLAVE